jgi:hypothetical protein
MAKESGRLKRAKQFAGGPPDFGGTPHRFSISQVPTFSVVLPRRSLSGGWHKFASRFIQAPIAGFPFSRRALPSTAVEFTEGRVFRDSLNNLASEPPPDSANRLVAFQVLSLPRGRTLNTNQRASNVKARLYYTPYPPTGRCTIWRNEGHRATRRFFCLSCSSLPFTGHWVALAGLVQSLTLFAIRGAGSRRKRGGLY